MCILSKSLFSEHFIHLAPKQVLTPIFTDSHLGKESLISNNIAQFHILCHKNHNNIKTNN